MSGIMTTEKIMRKNVLSFQSKQPSSRGFTLIEIMIVVAILGILAAIIVPKIMSRPEQARLVKAKQDVLELQNAFDLYKLDNGFYPSTQQGIQALVMQPISPPTPQNWKPGGYISRNPIDPWGRPYQYLNPGTHNPTGIDVFSYGPKGPNMNGVGYIGNWSSESTVNSNEQVPK